MKTLKLMMFLLIGLSIQFAKAQAVKEPARANWHFSPRVGYDLPKYRNNLPYIDYKGGLDVGLSVDHYWKWFGLGIDLDYIKNKPKSVYPTDNLFNSLSAPLTSFSTVENSITRTFAGIGPDFRYENKTGKFSAELNTRVGLAYIKGGRTELRETVTPLNQLLNFHAGYDVKNLLSAKAQLKANYFFNDYLGVNVGAYYLQHFNAPEMVDPTLNVSASYQPFRTSGTSNTYNGLRVDRVKPCNCDIASIGVFAGVVVRIPKSKEKPAQVNYALKIIAKDKYTHELLPETEVQIKNNVGTVIYSGITNSVGVVVFENVSPEDYVAYGKLYDTSLDPAGIAKSEFKNQAVVQKEILYGNRNFIIKGKIFACNTANPLSLTSVILENTEKAFKKTSITDAQGSFVFQLNEIGQYTLYGKKDNYFSQYEEITTSNYDRSKNLFIKLEMCAELIDCDKAIRLNNILFDLDKYFIKESAKPELNRLVRFMKDNPTVRVELSSHTDSRASAEYNMTLSQNRANASVDYIVSQGIARDRIEARGYGESKLLNGCADNVNCAEAQHAINRRTEMKVICNDKK
jgi:outer membrane protein OmpA-like peptidoglycan-associated protein